MQNIISLIFRYFLSLFPACAGVIPGYMMVEYLEMAFPRMCGGDPSNTRGPLARVCFSPHVRG